MKLLIKSIVIQVNNKPSVSYDFSRSLAVVEDSRVLRCVLDTVLSRETKIKLKSRISFIATVVADYEYIITGEKQKDEDSVFINVHRDNCDKDCTQEYFELIESNTEADTLLSFTKKNVGAYRHRLRQYKNPDVYNIQETLGKLTDGFSDTCTFRRFLNQYITEFAPQPLYKENLCFDLLSSGEFALCYNSGEKAAPADREDIVLCYLSYIYLNDFWSKVESVRNMNRINKPLLVSDLQSDVAEKYCLTDLLRQTHNLNRQTIIFVPCEDITAIKKVLRI